jgi:TetR/AcrR family transcriptional regulator, cholesterol catabolism regulator
MSRLTTDEGRSLVDSKIADEVLLAERHQQLVVAASDLFLQKGFHRTSIREIAEAVGWQMGTLYLYIKKKDDVLYLITRSMMEGFGRTLRQVEPEDNASQTLRKTLEVYFEAVNQRRREIQLLYRESASLAPEHSEELRGSELNSRQIFADIIKWGMSEGEFRDVDPEVHGHTCVFIAHMWALKGWAYWQRMSFEEFRDQQIRLLFEPLVRHS